jgi:outer membrane protein TolC
MARDVVMMIKESYFELQAVQRASAITRDDEQVLKRIETIAETLYSAGERTQQDVIKAQTEITMLKQKLLELQVQENTLTARLNVLLNRRPEAPLGLAGTPPPNPTGLDAQRLFDLADQARPEIRGAQAMIKRNEYERDLMKKEFWPDYRVGAEYRDPGDGDEMLMVTVGIDLPVWRSKNRAGVREARKMVESGEAALAAARQQAAFEVQDARFKLLSAGRTLDLYTTELIPQAQARFSSSEAGYRSGKVDFMELLESQRFLLNARIMAVMAEGSVGMQASRLERALGTTMDELKGLK